jgi:hypothetical protein
MPTLLIVAQYAFSDDDDEMTEGDSQQIDALLKATLGKYSGALHL